MQNSLRKTIARVKLLLGWMRTHTQDPIFALQPYLYTGWEIVRDESRHTDSQVHVEAILKFLCRTACNPVTNILDGRIGFPPTIQVRLRKSPNFYLLLCGGLYNAINIDAR